MCVWSPEVCTAGVRHTARVDMSSCSTPTRHERMKRYKSCTQIGECSTFLPQSHAHGVGCRLLTLGAPHPWRFGTYCCPPRFFDTGTRAVLLQFVLYNTNTRQLTNGRLVVEQFMSADFQMTHQFQTCKVEVYASKTDEVRHVSSVGFRLPRGGGGRTGCAVGGCALARSKTRWDRVGV